MSAVFFFPMDKQVALGGTFTSNVSVVWKIQDRLGVLALWLCEARAGIYYLNEQKIIQLCRALCMGIYRLCLNQFPPECREAFYSDFKRREFPGSFRKISSADHGCV
jgi:hypothetical protein